MVSTVARYSKFCSILSAILFKMILLSVDEVFSRFEMLFPPHLQPIPDLLWMNELPV
jgi:hypothetical protein